MTLDQAVERFTHALTNGADSYTVAEAWGDMVPLYRAHVTALHLGETVDGRAA